MATRTIDVVALLVFSLCGKCYMGHLRPEPNILLLILPRDSACSYGFLARPVPCADMPRERGKPCRGSTYYSIFGRHNCPRIASRALTLGGDHSGSSGKNWHVQAPIEIWPHHDQGLTSEARVLDEVPPGLSRLNWHAQAQQQTRPPSPESLQGGFPVEEEFLPNWAEFFPFLPSTVLERQPTTCTTRPLHESVIMGCIVEEEALPLEGHSRRNSFASMEEDPVTDSIASFNFVVATLDESQAQANYHPAPDSYRLMDDHLILIFEMKRDLAEQQHRQSLFGKRLDALYASLSSEPEKSRFSTCC